MIMMDREILRKLPLPEAHVDHLGHKVHRLSGFRPFSGLEVDLFFRFWNDILQMTLTLGVYDLFFLILYFENPFRIHCHFDAFLIVMLIQIEIDHRILVVRDRSKLQRVVKRW